MEWPAVRRRIDGGEDARTEFKQGIGDLSRVGRTPCASANGDGGLLAIDVDVESCESSCLGRHRARFGL